MSFPQPPNYKSQRPLPPPIPNGEPSPIGTPIIETQDGRLDDDETEFILNDTLKPRHRHDPNILRFITNYMRCRNNAQAARESGLPGTAGAYLRNKPDIHLAISKLTARSVNKYGFDASEVVERVKEISQLDPADLVASDGSIIEDLRLVPPETRRAIKKFKAKNIYEKDPNGMQIVVGKLIEVEFWDKMKAHEMLGREKELFKETKKVEHDVSGDMKNFLLESRKLADEAVIGMRDVTQPIQIEARRDVINLDKPK